MFGKTKPKEIADRVRQANNELREGVISLRDLIAKLVDKREAILAKPPEESVAIARMVEWVDREAINSKQHAPEPLRFARAHYEAPQYFKLDHIAFAFLAGAIKSALTAEIRELYKTNPGVSDDIRANQLAAVEDDLLDAEIAEESIIRDAEAMGFRIARRANADPRVVLAADSEMPK